MKTVMHIVSLLFVIQFLCACNQKVQNRIELAGQWKFQIDSLDQGISEKWCNLELKETVKLPGTVSENGKGRKVDHVTNWIGNLQNEKWYEDENYKPYLDEDRFLFPYWLIPEQHYFGAAWFQKEVEIPANWKNEKIELVLERCHWETQLWVDDKKVGSNNSLGTPHRYDLTDFITTGKHRLTVCVDNRVKNINVGQNSHSISDHTQGNWNGIVGELYLEKAPHVMIRNVQVFPDVQNKSVSVKLEVDNTSGAKKEAELCLQVQSISATNISKREDVISTIVLPLNKKEIVIEYPMGDDVLLWDEFNPNLYKLSVTVKSDETQHKKETTFGMREFVVRNKQITINTRPVFLRGTLECAIFPKTGYPPTDVKEWKRIISICKAHGLNHIRFHSWCPPKAAFIAADEMGFYYQVECSSWANQGATIGDNKPIDKWIYDESERMIAEYGNHPSFCMMAYGNEPAGANQAKFLGDFIRYWKKDNRRIYTSAGGWPAIPENDFHNLPQPRIQGWGEQLNSIINREAPKTNYDWRDKLQDNDRPVVSHEIGQWCVYPNFKEIEKYDGHLKATNFEIFRRSLKAHKMEHLADSFLLASGKLQALCYKADIEAALRTPGFGGFQLLDLHDFPGQGTALVGVLDPFWEEKGYITPEEYSRFCNETVPLARFGKRVFVSDEAIEVGIEISHFGEKELKELLTNWKITNTSGEIISNGQFSSTKVGWGNATKLGEISTSVNTQKPLQLNLEVSCAGFVNDWDFWVYPKKTKQKRDVLIVQELNQKAVDVLEKGGKVLLSLEKGSVKADKGGNVGIGFSSIFWNTAWTGGQKPHTLGILCDPKHPALSEFPTEFHSNWQWWDAMSHSNAISLESFSEDINPIVRVIDDWVSNKRLALIFEVKVGKGSLLVSGIDLKNNLNKRPEAVQLLTSLENYMNSHKFNPQVDVTAKEISDLYN